MFYEPLEYVHFPFFIDAITTLDEVSEELIIPEYFGKRASEERGALRR